MDVSAKKNVLEMMNCGTKRLFLGRALGAYLFHQRGVETG